MCTNYEDRWTPRVGETLQCLWKGNREDRFAVAVYKDRDIVSYVPRSSYIDTIYGVHGHSISRNI